MGRRSRKRSDAVPRPAAPVTAPAAPAALRHRAPARERPEAPWGGFPLGELTTLAGIVVLVVGFFSDSARLIAVGFALVALSATELVAREHFTGFRSHSALLALIAGAATAVGLVVADVPRALQLGGAVAVFLAAFWLLRRTFMAKTGGLGFRA